MTSGDTILIRKEESITWITINQPRTLNALNSDLIKKLGEAFDSIYDDNTVRVVVLTGTERSFVAGADIAAMKDMDKAKAKEFGELGSSVFRKIEECPRPVIACVNGFALGGGCELTLACDIRIASDKAKFGQPEVTLGICPGFSGTQRLTRIVGQAKAKELIYTGKVINAQEAEVIGLVNKVVPHDELIAETTKLAEQIANQAPIAVAYSKMAIDKGYDMYIEDGIKYEVDLFSRCFETADQKNGMTAFVNKEKVKYEGK